MALQFVSKVCTGCGRAFRTSNDSSKCYNCTLSDITRGMPPEEGDFNTAGIVSGTLTAQERRYLQSDLESVERTTDEEYGYDQDGDEEPYSWKFDEWEDAKLGHEG